MKKSIIVFGLLISGLAQAAGTQFICKEITDGEKRTVVLTQSSDRKFKEGEKEAFTLAIFNTGDKTPALFAKGTVQTEDVKLSFTSSGRKVSFDIYMDEPNQSFLTLDGKSSGTFDCN